MIFFIKGFCWASLKLVMAIINMRFDNNTSRVMDMNKQSYLPNLRRALQFRLKLDDNQDNENLLLKIIRPNANFWFDFRKTEWVTVTHQTLSEILFPFVKYDKSESDTYLNLEAAHIYHFAIGTYGIKRALKYLNHATYDMKLFNLQFLSEQSDIYRSVKNNHFQGEPIKIVRFKIQSYHKKQEFNIDGYRGYLIYRPVVTYDPRDNTRFRLLGNTGPTNLNHSDYYFQNSFKAWFCVCKTGQRNVGACSHIIAALIGFGNPGDFSKARYLPLNPTIFAEH